MIVTNTLVHRHRWEGGWWTQVQSCHHFDQKGNPRESFVLSMADDERADRSIQLRVLTSRGGLLHEILCQAKPHELINRLAAARKFPFVPLEKSVEFHVGPPLRLGSKWNLRCQWIPASGSGEIVLEREGQVQASIYREIPP